MASDPQFVKFVCEQLSGAGEAAVYLEDKVIGLICDNQFFVKPTQPGRAKIGVPTEAPPFPGAGNWFLMADLDDPDFLADLVRTTAAALPARKIKAKKTLRAKSKQPSAKE